MSAGAAARSPANANRSGRWDVPIRRSDRVGVAVMDSGDNAGSGVEEEPCSAVVAGLTRKL
jgi:hypothetical protein